MVGTEEMNQMAADISNGAVEPPSDKREEAVVTVIEQAEAVCRDWAEAA
jgi:hypothetical protein